MGCAFACCLSRFTLQAFAIEGLQISVQSTNAVLSWPSTNIETYMVQYRSNLNASSSWLTLADNFSAASNTNLTSFQHSPTNRSAGFYRVVRDGAHLWGITNGMTLSGMVTIPVEVANGYGDLTSLSLTEDEAPVDGATSQDSPISLPLQLTVDTTQMSNGVHQISASARWDDTNGGLWEADSPPVTVNVYNEITFPNWMPRFGELGNTLMIAVQSAHTDADWWVDIYDSQYVYIGTFSGHTYDGTIEGYWDLTGPYGEFHGDDTFHFVVTTEWTSSLVQQGGASPAASGTAHSGTPQLWKATDPWSGPGGWVGVAQHAFDNLRDHDLLYAELGGFVGAAQNVGWQVSPPPYTDDNDNLAPFAINFQNVSEAGDWTTFRNALYNPNSRNLVYFGHGGANNLGIWGNTNTSISAKEIASHLHTIPDNQTNRHAFRFVFLDGCSTAKGKLPEAFGVIHRPIKDVGYYSGASIRPSAFAGWSADKWVSNALGISIYYPHVNFISHIQTQMLAFGWGLKESVDYAANAPDVYWSFLWTGQFKVFGFTDLHYGQYNN